MLVPFFEKTILPSPLSKIAWIQFTRSVMCDSLRPHELQHAWPPRHHQLPEFTQTHVHWISDAIQLYYPLSSPSAFSLCQHQSIGASASISVPSMNIQDWFPLGWTGWISLESKGLKNLLQHHGSEASVLQCSAFFTVKLASIHDYWKNHSFD